MGKVSSQAIAVVAHHVVTRMAAATVEDARARYDFGHVLHLIRYADNAALRIRQVAVLLKVDSSALHRYARVSETISPPEFNWLVTLRTSRGMPLTWSHLEQLATERSSARRARFARVAVQEQFSVRKLISAMSETQASARPAKETVSKSPSLPRRQD
jgi:hypothetical protein